MFLLEAGISVAKTHNPKRFETQIGPIIKTTPNTWTKKCSFSQPVFLINLSTRSSSSSSAGPVLLLCGFAGGTWSRFDNSCGLPPIQMPYLLFWTYCWMPLYVPKLKCREYFYIVGILIPHTSQFHHHHRFLSQEWNSTVIGCVKSYNSLFICVNSCYPSRAD